MVVRLITLACDSSDGNSQSASNPVNRRGARTTLLAFDVGQRGLTHPDPPCEFGLVPAVLLAKTADSRAVLTQSLWNPADGLSHGRRDRLCHAHAG